ncbi:MAG TPA: OB-fold domain-containing protein [Actinomycetales bacterium]|nr:OB-fold domain-containing protein [Actinomycetales bacterium]
MTAWGEERFHDLVVAPPTPTGESQYFWDCAREGRLVLQRCTSCGSCQGYPRRRCARCWSADLEWVDSSGHGRVVTHTLVHRPGQTSWQVIAPYYVGLVRVDEGAVLLSHLVVDDGAAPTVGDRCQVEPTTVGEWTLPFFRLWTS